MARQKQNDKQGVTPDTPIKIERTSYDEYNQKKRSYKTPSNNMVNVYCKYGPGMKYNTEYGPVRIPGLFVKDPFEKGCLLINGYMRSKISVDIWNEIVSKHGHEPMFVRHFIFVEENENDGTSHAKELKSEKTGLERLDPKEIHADIKPLNAEN